MINPAIYDQQWYYSVELEPGRFTNGLDHTNIASTRTALDAIEASGHSVIDLSTMEGMFATLLAKRGATVTATDTIDCGQRIALLQRAHGVTFHYLPHVPLENPSEYLFKYQTSTFFSPIKPLRAALHTPYGYDIVLSSGVMYHVLSPIHYILQLRKMVKLGGIVVIETACAISDNIEIHHGYRGDSFLYNGRASWFITTGALDLSLRAAYLTPLGFCYFTQRTKSDLRIIRLGLVARAVERPAFQPEFLQRIETSEIVTNKDYKPLYEAAQLIGSVAEPVVYREDVLHPVGAKLSADLFDRYSEVEYEPGYLRLALADR